MCVVMKIVVKFFVNNIKLRRISEDKIVIVFKDKDKLSLDEIMIWRRK